MKKIILISTSIATLNVFAFGVNLENQGKMTLQHLTDIGAEYVQCEQQSPKCILQGKKFGIQYPGQKLEDVVLTEETGAVAVQLAISTIKKLKREGLCK